MRRWLSAIMKTSTMKLSRFSSKRPPKSLKLSANISHAGRRISTIARRWLNSAAPSTPSKAVAAWWAPMRSASWPGRLKICLIACSITRSAHKRRMCALLKMSAACCRAWLPPSATTNSTRKRPWLKLIASKPNPCRRGLFPTRWSKKSQIAMHSQPTTPSKPLQRKWLPRRSLNLKRSVSTIRQITMSICWRRLPRINYRSKKRTQMPMCWIWVMKSASRKIWLMQSSTSSSWSRICTANQQMKSCLMPKLHRC